MKLVKTTKLHFIYQLTDKEMKENDYTSPFLLFLKSSYPDSKPIANIDIGYEDWETDTLEEAIEWSKSDE